MKRQWNDLSSRLEALTLRERILVTLAIVFVLVALLNVLLLEPLRNKHKQAVEQINQQRDQLRDASTKFAELLQARRGNVQEPVHDQIAQLRQQLSDGSGYLRSWSERLVPPERIAVLLEQVLGNNTKLQLVKLDTLPVVPLFNAKGKDGLATGTSQEQQIFKHGVEISVRGGYAELVQYLTTLEHLPAQMYWGRVKLNVEQYPNSTLTLTLYTLSMDKTWLVL